jgi:hypothetical protein
MVALSYHFKALITMPVFAAAILMASRGPRAMLPRALALALLVAAALAAMHYWSARLACPLDPLINREFNRQNIGAQIANNATAGSGGLFTWSGRAAPICASTSTSMRPRLRSGRCRTGWCGPGQRRRVHGWRGGMTVIWALAGACRRHRR